MSTEKRVATAAMASVRRIAPILNARIVLKFLALSIGASLFAACSSPGSVGIVPSGSDSSKSSAGVGRHPSVNGTYSCNPDVVGDCPSGPWDSGGAGGGTPNKPDTGGSGGGGATGPSGGPLKPAGTGCASKTKTTGTAYAKLNGTNPAVFNDPPAGSNGQEAYGYVYTNGTTFAYDGPKYVALAAGSTTATPNAAQSYTGWAAVGFWHTHPHQPGADPTQLDTDTGLHFSRADVNFAISTGLTMYVAVLDSIGTADANNAQVRWYSYDTTNNKESLEGTVGSGGC